MKHRIIKRSGLTVPELGFGAASLGNLYRPVSDEQARGVVDAAWAAGMRYFDTAPHYGQGLSERRLGDALRGHLRDGASDCVISTKVGRILRPAGFAPERHGFVSPMPFDIEYDYSYDGIMRSFEHSQQRLGLDTIDILYVHDIGKDTHGAANAQHFATLMDGGYKALDELRASGAVKAIGLGVNEYQVCEEAMAHGDFDCFLLAGRYTLLEQESLQSFMPQCVKRDVSVVVGGAYNSGILATGTRGSSTPYYNYEPAPQAIIERVARIETLCDEFKVTLAAAALQFPLAHEAVVSVIPGLGSARRVAATLALIEEQIPTDFWLAMKDADLLVEGTPLPGLEGSRE